MQDSLTKEQVLDLLNTLIRANETRLEYLEEATMHSPIKRHAEIQLNASNIIALTTAYNLVKRIK